MDSLKIGGEIFLEENPVSDHQTIIDRTLSRFSCRLFLEITDQRVENQTKPAVFSASQS
jgi:hypothetical protein